jgi:hypothetical protein
MRGRPGIFSIMQVVIDFHRSKVSPESKAETIIFYITLRIFVPGSGLSSVYLLALESIEKRLL